MSVIAPPISDQQLLDAIVHEPDSFESGLRLRETDPTSERKPCVTSGFDRNGRPVVLYVMDDVVKVADIKAALACRRGPDDETIGRVIVLAAGFHDDWHFDPPPLPAGWELELLRWHIRSERVGGESVVEISKGEYEGEGLGSFVPSLTDREIESLVGPGPAGAAGGRA